MPDRETMNISVSPEHKAFVKAQVAGGRYRNDSEVVRDALRLLEEQDRQRRLEEALIAGLDSGDALTLDERGMGVLRQRLTDRIDASRRDRRARPA
ncbi:MAG: type II toxin-antitoxin system ParD family antitoxin [Phycisphaerales bacterium]